MTRFYGVREVWYIRVLPSGYANKRGVTLYEDNAVGVQIHRDECCCCEACQNRVRSVRECLEAKGARYAYSGGWFTIQGFPNDGDPTPEKVCQWLEGQIGVCLEIVVR